MPPILKQVKDALKEDIIILKVDVDKKSSGSSCIPNSGCTNVNGF
jgi:hypothetical protein